MGFKVIFAPQAIQWLEQIVTHIAKDNPDAALQFGMRLVDHAELLADFPELGQVYRKRRGVRCLSCRPYVIYYRVNQASRTVEIMDYWHAAQREPKMLPLTTDRAANEKGRSWRSRSRRSRTDSCHAPTPR